MFTAVLFVSAKKQNKRKTLAGGWVFKWCAHRVDTCTATKMSEVELKRVQMAKSQKFNMDYKKSLQRVQFVTLHIKF